MPSLEQASHWNRSLRWFRFSFAHGGPANDMDTLSARIPFDGTETGLLLLVDRLGVRDSIQPSVPGASARALPGFPNLFTPDVVRILDAPAFLLINRDVVHLIAAGAHGKNWEVTADDFANAVRLEEVLPTRGIQFEPRAPLTLVETVFDEAIALGLGEARSRTSDPKRHADWMQLCTNLAVRFPLLSDERVWSDTLAQIEYLENCTRPIDVAEDWIAMRLPGFTPNTITKARARAVEIAQTKTPRER